MCLESAFDPVLCAPLPMAQDRIVVFCAADDLWRTLATVSPLPRWSAVVRAQSAARQVPTRVGSVRDWSLALGRRGVRVSERCIAAETGKRLVFLVEPGPGRRAGLLAGLVFSFELEPVDEGKTMLCLRTYYLPAGGLARVLRSEPMRRRFAALRLVMLRNLKRVAERTAVRTRSVALPFDMGGVVPPVALLARER